MNDSFSAAALLRSGLLSRYSSSPRMARSDDATVLESVMPSMLRAGAIERESDSPSETLSESVLILDELLESALVLLSESVLAAVSVRPSVKSFCRAFRNSLWFDFESPALMMLPTRSCLEDDF